MTTSSPTEELFVTTVDIDDRRYNVTVEVVFDGIEHVGHLWFSDEAWDDDGARDHGAIAGRDTNDVLRHAQTLSPADLTLRFRRAQADKRRYHGLRRATEDVLQGIRYLNKVATSMRAGLLDVQEAAAELDETERRLHTMIGELRRCAGVSE